MKIEIRSRDSSIVYADSHWEMDMSGVRLLQTTGGREPSLRVGQTIRIDGSLKHVTRIALNPRWSPGVAKFVYELADGETPPPLEWYNITNPK